MEALVPLESDDPTLANTYVPVPMPDLAGAATDDAEVADAEAADATDAPPAPLDQDIAREVQAWARNLIATGSVAGIAATAPSYGPPHRPTHEFVEDDQGRRILRRVGYSAT